MMLRCEVRAQPIKRSRQGTHMPRPTMASIHDPEKHHEGVLAVGHVCARAVRRVAERVSASVSLTLRGLSVVGVRTRPRQRQTAVRTPTAPAP